MINKNYVCLSDGIVLLRNKGHIVINGIPYYVDFDYLSPVGNYSISGKPGNIKIKCGNGIPADEAGKILMLPLVDNNQMEELLWK